MSIPTPHRRWKFLIIALGLLAFGIQWSRMLKRPDGDFHLHWELGRRLWAGTFLYENGTDYPYPPFWGVAHMPAALTGDYHTAQKLLYPLFLVALGTLIWTLNRLTARSLPLARDPLFWSTAVALFLGSRYLVRDMPEIGVNLTLVALSYLGVWLWTQRREWLGGASLGLAMALKCTPSLFLVWFLYKRQWKMAGTTFVAAAAFTLSPALVMGPTEFQHTFGVWAGNVVQGVTKSDPTRGMFQEEPFQNMSLKPALARYLTVVKSENHISRPHHPGYLDFLDLSHGTAQWIIRGVLLAILVTAGWIFRRPVTDREDVGLVWECAAVSVLILLFSPITWGQHCVGLVPALYLISRRRFHGTPLLRWETAALATYAILILGLNRGLVGKSTSLLLASYRDATLGFLLLLTITLAARVRAASAAASSTPHEDASPTREDTSRATFTPPRRLAA